jgi:hypothetical protein
MKRCSLALLSWLILLPSIRAQYPAYQYLNCPACAAQTGNASTMLAALQAQQQQAPQPALQAGAGVSLNLTAGQIWALAQEDARIRSEREQLERDRLALVAAQSADRNRAALAYAGGGLGGIGGINALDGGINLSALYAMNALRAGGCTTCGLGQPAVNLASAGCIGGFAGNYSIPVTIDLSFRSGFDRSFDRGYCPSCGYGRSWDWGRFDSPVREYVYEREPYTSCTCGQNRTGGEVFSFNGEGLNYERGGEERGVCGSEGGRRGRERMRFSLRRR